LKHVSHVSLFTYDEAKISQDDQSLLLSKRQTAGDSSDNWPLGVVIGLIFILPVIIIVVFGFWVTFSLQSEFRFDAETSVANILKKHK